MKQRQDPFSGPQRIQQITGNAFQISFHPDWQIHKGFFNKPIMVHTQILVPRWWLRTRIPVRFCKQT